MFFKDQLYGDKLNPFTLSFTFDDGPGKTEGDGPGPKTLRLAQYLSDQRIYSTFFAVGKFMKQYPEILREVFKMGHLIGNHTFTHPNLCEAYNSDSDIVSEIRGTDHLISELLKDNKVYFRAPYGVWKPEIADHFNKYLGKKYDYIGPFNWDINCNDYNYWLQGSSAEDCANAYLIQIKRLNRGIILMHDSTADNETMKNNNLTFEAVKILVPQLKSLGYKFVRLDEVADI